MTIEDPMIEGVQAASVGPEGLPSMRAALLKAGLPADDLEAPGLKLFAFKVADETVGFGGLETCGGDRLLRSVVVDPNRRGEGIGRRIVEFLLASAREAGVSRVYLPTAGARDYFEGLGFAAIDRRSAPPEVIATRQMASLCPASATLMTRKLDQ